MITLFVNEPTLPERGAVNLCINRAFEIRVTAEEARRQVKRWLLNEVSYMFTAKFPTLLVAERIVWRVSVIFTAAHIGHVGMVGEIDVDVETGAMNNTPMCKETLLTQARKLADAMPPYQSRTATPELWLAYDANPTHSAGKPAGNPLDLLPTI